MTLGASLLGVRWKEMRDLLSLILNWRHPHKQNVCWHKLISVVIVFFFFFFSFSSFSSSPPPPLLLLPPLVVHGNSSYKEPQFIWDMKPAGAGGSWLWCPSTPEIHEKKGGYFWASLESSLWNIWQVLQTHSDLASLLSWESRETWHPDILTQKLQCEKLCLSVRGDSFSPLIRTEVKKGQEGYSEAQERHTVGAEESWPRKCIFTKQGHRKVPCELENGCSSKTNYSRTVFLLEASLEEVNSKVSKSMGWGAFYEETHSGSCEFSQGSWQKQGSGCLPVWVHRYI